MCVALLDMRPASSLLCFVIGFRDTEIKLVGLVKELSVSSLMDKKKKKKTSGPRAINQRLAVCKEPAYTQLQPKRWQQ